jgi:hypothetical protein
VSEEKSEHEPDVVDKAFEAFDHVLDVVHDRILRPILVAGRTIAFGFILLLIAAVLLTVLVIGIIRLLNVYIFDGHEWLSCLIVGGILVITGLIIWRRRRPANLRK